MKRLFVMVLAVGIGSSAFAAPAVLSQGVVAVAQSTIVYFGLFRIQGLGGAVEKKLGQNQICILAGQASIGFQVLTASGLSEGEVADLLKGLLQSGLTIDQIRSQLHADMADCIR